MEEAAKCPCSTCPAFPPDPNTRLPLEQAEPVPHARFSPQEGEAQQEGGRPSQLREMFREHQAVPTMSLQIPTARVPASDLMPGSTQDLV